MDDNLSHAWTAHHDVAASSAEKRLCAGEARWLAVKTVQRICKGEGKQPSVWTIAAIARVLDVSIDELVGMLEATATAKQVQETRQADPSAVKRTRASKVASRA